MSVAVALLLGAVPLLLVAAWPAPVGAATDPLDCDAVVVDASGALDVAAVEAAAAGIDLDRIGPDAAVVVRVWDVVPGEDLMRAVDELVIDCFGDPVGGIADEVAVLAFSVGDGLSDVLLGGGWVGAVPDAARLRADVLGPPLSAGDVTGGFVAALDEMAVSVASLPDPTSTTSTTEPGSDQGEVTVIPAPTVGSEPATEPVDVPSADDGAGGGRSPWAVGGAVLGLGACGAAVVGVQRQRKLARARDALRRRVDPAIGRLGVVRERHRQLIDQADGWQRTSAGRTRTEVIDDVRGAEAAAAATDRAAGLLHQALPDGSGEADRPAVERAGEHVSELSRALAAHGEELDELAALGAHLDHLEVAVPAKAEVLAHELPEVRRLANDRAGDGWNVEAARDGLTDVQAAVAEVKEAVPLLEVDLLALSDRIEAAEASLFAIAHDLEVLPDRGPSLQRWQQQLAEAADHELHRVDEVRRQLSAAAAVHAADSWRWAADHPQLAVEALERVDEHRQVVLTQLIPGQRFDDAGRLLERAGLDLIAADGLLDEVDDLVVDLERSLVEAPAALAQVQGELRRLAGAVDRMRTDLTDDVIRRRRELVAAVDGLGFELGRPKPNHLQIFELAEQMGRDIDGLLDEAEAQHERAEALRREAERQVARADRAVARARRSLGWQLFPSADGAAIDRLESQLRSMPADPATAIDLAADIADDALRIQEQILARRRRRGVAVGSGPSIPSGSGWSLGNAGRRSSGGSRRRTRAGSRSSGGRSFGGRSRSRSRSRGGRALGSRRSTGRV
ncbi:MAG: hypothetical protein AAGA93_19650 [Actinomycetota bacterium]